jgi:hypothetical protein
MELLATIDWLIQNDGVAADRESIKTALKTWTGGETSAARKLKPFEDQRPHFVNSLLFPSVRRTAPLSQSSSSGICKKLTLTAVDVRMYALKQDTPTKLVFRSRAAREA